MFLLFAVVVAVVNVDALFPLPVHALERAVLGRSFIVRDPAPGVDPGRRSLSVVARERSTQLAVVGDPMANGVTVEISADGASASMQTFVLPPGAATADAAGWKTLRGPVAGYLYSDKPGTNGPIRTALLKLTPDGKFILKVVAKGPGGLIQVLPPAPGTSGAMSFGIAGGDRYVVGFGGSAGGRIINAPAHGVPNKLFKIVIDSTAAAPDTWISRTPMMTPRFGAAAAEMGGLIYVFGGFNSGGYLATTEVYDPIADVWVQRAPMPSARSQPAAASAHGKIYAVGGWDGAAVDAVEEYDPAGDTWTSKGRMPAPPAFGPGAGSVNDRIFTMGGWRLNDQAEPEGLATTNEYDPAADTWMPRAPMPTGRYGVATAVVDGQIYVIGGTDTISPLPTVEAYDPVADVWSSKASLRWARYAPGAAVVDGKIFVLGGGWAGQPTSVMEEYDPLTDRWTQRVPLSVASLGLIAAAPGGRLYAAGGWSGDEYLAAVAEYVPPPHLP